jgi:hypothetical protein
LPRALATLGSVNKPRVEWDSVDIRFTGLTVEVTRERRAKVISNETVSSLAYHRFCPEMTDSQTNWLASLESRLSGFHNVTV